MVKRKLSEEPASIQSKRTKVDPRSINRLSSLSHELILRVLSFLSVPDLIVCHRLSHDFQDLSSDSQIWKALYYNRFVRPRASRIPGIRDSGVPADSLYFSSKLSKWLDEEGLVKRGSETNWKRQYKLRHNWSKGSCAVSEIPVAEQPSVPPILVQMHDSTILLADQTDGLRAWNSKSGRKLLARIGFEDMTGHDRTTTPSALAIDTASDPDHGINVAIGFQDGSFSIFELDKDGSEFQHRYRHPPSSNGMIGAIALSSPYLATMTANQLLSLYRFKSNDDEPSQAPPSALDPPRLLHSLHSHTCWPPLTLSIRPTSDSVLLCIAYALPTYLSGWTVGIQEIRLSPTTGLLLSSRLASAIDQTFRPLSFTSTSPPTPPSSSTPTAVPAFYTPEASQIHSKPTSLSYTHPYLLVSHPDNTLTLYLVSSTTDALSVSAGSRLWGHTSSVSGAHVGGRGKAVSVTSRGDELRVWSLEGGLGAATAAARRGRREGGLSVRIRADRVGALGEAGIETPDVAQDPAESRVGARVVSEAVAARGNGLGLALEYGRNTTFDEMSLTRGWVGFDEENIVVLKEKSCGGQALVVYDFA